LSNPASTALPEVIRRGASGATRGSFAGAVAVGVGEEGVLDGVELGETGGIGRSVEWLVGASSSPTSRCAPRTVAGTSAATTATAIAHLEVPDRRGPPRGFAGRGARWLPAKFLTCAVGAWWPGV
jgi:hypothetical protein